MHEAGAPYATFLPQFRLQPETAYAHVYVQVQVHISIHSLFVLYVFIHCSGFFLLNVSLNMFSPICSPICPEMLGTWLVVFFLNHLVCRAATEAWPALLGGGGCHALGLQVKCRRHRRRRRGRRRRRRPKVDGAPWWQKGEGPLRIP